MADSLVNVQGSTVQEFLDNAHKAMHDKKKLGETSYDLKAAFKMDPKTKKIGSATMTLKLDTKRVHWSGAGGGTPDPKQAAAIQKIEDMNAEHEKEHRTTYQRAFDKAQKALEKEMVGKTPKEAEAVMKKMHDALLDACEKLHKSGGLIEVDDDGQGNIKITESAEGPGGCK